VYFSDARRVFPPVVIHFPGSPGVAPPVWTAVGFGLGVVGFDNLILLASSCPGSWPVSDMSSLDWEDVALAVSGRGRNTRMVESSLIIHSSLCS